MEEQDVLTVELENEETSQSFASSPSSDLATYSIGGEDVEPVQSSASGETMGSIHDYDKEDVEVPSITWKEYKALKKAKYDKIRDKYDTAYVIQNKKTGQAVEIRAASAFMACKIIGWKYKQCKLIETKNVEEATPSTDKTIEEFAKENEECPALQ
jgi:hypothetical protein